MMRTREHRAWLGRLLALAILVSGTPLQAAGDEQTLPGLDGGRLTKADLARGHTIAVVWSSWSPRSRDIGARVAAISAKWGERARVITVNFQEDPKKAREFARAQKLDLPIFLDREAVFAKRHAVTSLPFLLIFAKGETVFAGRLPADPNPVIARALD